MNTTIRIFALFSLTVFANSLSNPVQGQALPVPYSQNFNAFPAGEFFSPTEGWTDGGGTSNNLSIYLSGYWTKCDDTQPIILRNRNTGMTIPKWTVSLVSPEIVVSLTDPIVVSWAETSYPVYNTSGFIGSPRTLLVKKVSESNWTNLDSYLSSDIPASIANQPDWRVKVISIPSSFSGTAVQFKWECQSLNDEYNYWCLDNIYVGPDGPVFDIVGETAPHELDFQAQPYWDLSQRILTVTNSGRGTLVLNTPYLTTPAGSRFTVISGQGTFAIQHGEQTPHGIDIYVNFQPQVPGEYLSELNIPYQIDGINYIYSISLKGKGIDCSEAVEIIQPDPVNNPPIEVYGYQGQLYKYTPQFQQDLVINSCFSCQIGYTNNYAWDTYLQVFSACPFNQITPITFNDDMENSCSYNRAASEVTLSLDPCQAIYIYWPFRFPTARHALDKFYFRMIISPTGPPRTPLSLALSGDNHVYSGYLPQYQTSTITSTVTGGTLPYSYQWSNGETTPSITVIPALTTSYFITVTDAFGCTVTEVFIVEVENVLVPGNNPNNNKIRICHNGHEIEVSINAVSAHIPGHPGDHLGYCTGPGPGPGNEDALSSDCPTLDVFPNPNSGSFAIHINPLSEGRILLEIKDLIGKSVYRDVTDSVGGTLIKEIRLPDARPGLYFIIVNNGRQTASKKIIVH